MIAADGPSRPPNVVIVVLDCVRGWDFPDGADGLTGMPFLERLRPECVVFPKAAAVAPWTIPSHASVFSGLYPWEHETHGHRSLTLRKDVPRLAQMLKPLNYRSFSLSANVLLCPPSGLVDGFDFVAWGSLIDQYLRLENRASPPHSVGLDGIFPHPKLGLGGHLLSRLPHANIPFRFILERNVSLPAIAGYAWRGMHGNDPSDEFSVARWIEPTFEKILDSTDRSDPIFGFVNLCDAHEPYFPWPDAVGTPELLWRWLRTRQDRPGWLARQNGNGSWDLGLLHNLYRSSIRSVDHRIQRLVESLQRHGRWDNTLLVVTSDHGQAFGEKRMLYHRFRVDESMIRIPLWVRFPRNTRSSSRAVGWASLVDIVPTVREAVGLPPSRSLDGRSLTQVIDDPRPDPVLAIADGSMGERWIPPSRLPELDRIAVAVYSEDSKITYTATPDEVHAYDVVRDPHEVHDVWSQRSDRFRMWLDLAKDVATKLQAAPRLAQSPEVLERLRGWGYA